MTDTNKTTNNAYADESQFAWKNLSEVIDKHGEDRIDWGRLTRHKFSAVGLYNERIEWCPRGVPSNDKTLHGILNQDIAADLADFIYDRLSVKEGSRLWTLYVRYAGEVPLKVETPSQMNPGQVALVKHRYTGRYDHVMRLMDGNLLVLDKATMVNDNWKDLEVLNHFESFDEFLESQQA